MSKMGENQIDVSVIIVNYNTIDLTLNCIKSVYASEVNYTFEIILVDNASSDGTVDVVKRLFPGVRIIENKKNVGFAIANNQAAEIAAGRYFYILNSDTEIEKNVIEEVISYGDSNPQVGVIGTKVVLPDGTIQETYYKFPSLMSEWIFFTIGIIKTKNWGLFRLNKYKNYLTDEPFEVDVIAGCSLFVKRSVFENVGLFNERFFMYYEDGEFCYRVNKSGKKCMYFPSVYIKHIHMGTSKKNGVNFKLLVSCFHSATIYFSYVKNSTYASIFKKLCIFIWIFELILLKIIFTVTNKERARKKIVMLQTLLDS